MNAPTPRAVLDRLAAAGISVRVEGGNIKLRGRNPPPDLLADLRAAKPALVELLTTDAAEEQAPPQAAPTPPTAPAEEQHPAVALLAKLPRRQAEAPPPAEPAERPTDADAAEEQAARQGEKPLPSPGTAERDKLGRDHAAYLNGMMAAALKRPPSWWEAEPHRPPPGATCSCCRWRRWWSRDGRGWCCSTCHPPVPGETVTEVDTLARL